MTYAKVEWNVEDVTEMFDVTEDAAGDFLSRNERALQDLLVERGFEALEEYGAMEGLPKRVRADAE